MNFGCSTTLKITEIKELSKTNFDSLTIKPDIELYDFRIDIIRQKSEKQVDDCTTETKDVPYHFLGFNLGNGLFYDLNGNLSLRINYLLNIHTDNDFEIEKVYPKNKWNRKYKSHKGKFTIKYSRIKKTYEKFQVDNLNDSLSISYKNKHRYSIVTNDSLTKYMNTKRVLDEIQKKDINFYYQKHRRRVDEYKLVDKSIILDNKYKITQNKSGDIIQIFRIGKKKDYPVYKIIRNDKNLFIYNDKFYGKKIIMDSAKFTVYYNDKIGYVYKIIN